MNKTFISTAVSGFLMFGLAAMSVAADPKNEFVGSEKCKNCHSEEYKSWKDTWHSKIVRPKKEGILKEVVEKWTNDGTGEGPTTGNVTNAKFKLDDVKSLLSG